MKAFLTSCNRPFELRKTLQSLEPILDEIPVIRIHEDCDMREIDQIKKDTPFHIDLVRMNCGQIKSINRFIDSAKGDYYLHLEDDWHFNENVKTFINDSLDIMSKDNSIIKVIARGENRMNAYNENGIEYLDETELYGKKWYGFSWNPGVTNLKLLKNLDVNRSEHDINLACHNMGYKVAYLPYPLYTHIGKNSTRK